MNISVLVARILAIAALMALSSCTTSSRASFVGSYLGYDEDRMFRVDDDADFSSKRPESLKKYWTISAVKLADEHVLKIPSKKRLFVAEKDGFLYFCVAYMYEHYVWGPSPQDPELITTTAKYWVYGLDRYRVRISSLGSDWPNQAPEPHRRQGYGGHGNNPATAVTPPTAQEPRQP